MKTEQLYDNWKKLRSQIELGDGFIGDVMNQIYQYERLKRKPLFDVQRFLEFVSVHPIAKAGLIAAGAIGGLVRAALMIHVLLFGN